MSKIIPGRQTADVSAVLRDDTDSLVVFIVGMRINKPWLPHKWVPPFRAMGPMLRELAAHPELGMLGARTTLGSTISVIQYWRSFDHLERFAKGEHHLPAWRDFNAKAVASGAVGLYHETFNVASSETLYHNMPAYGLAAATEVAPVERLGNAARERISRAKRAGSAEEVDKTAAARTEAV